jgi:hypothetical protein
MMAGMEPNDPGHPSPSPIPAKPMGSLPPAVAPPRARSPKSEPPPSARPPFDAGGALPVPAVPSAAPLAAPEKAIAEQLEALDLWARANRRDGRRAVMRYCLLKGPALVCIVAALVAESLAAGQGVIVLTAMAAVAIAIDAAWASPSNQPHRRAISDVRDLQNTVKLRWDTIRIAHPDPRDPSRAAEALAILDLIQQRREMIGKSLANRGGAAPAEAQ